MTFGEWCRTIVGVCDHPLYQHVRRELRRQQRGRARLRAVDIGGRRSPYTIGLRAAVTVTDVPRASVVQHALNLGATEEIVHRVRAGRSNVIEYVLDDMTKTALAPGSYDLAIAVEVLEHVAEDELFVRNVARVLEAEGVFVMTTPNGDFLTTPYPDHERHYRGGQLDSLLRRHFRNVEMRYVVDAGRLITVGRYRPRWRAPVRSLLAVGALWLSARLERWTPRGPQGKRHLLAVASGPRR